MSAPPFSACLFDLDGTLMDSETLWVEATIGFLAARGISVSHDEAQELVYGRSWHDVHRDICARWPSVAQPLPAMEAAMRPAFRRLRAERDIRIPGSLALLRRLAADYPVGIVSGSSRTEVDEGIRYLGIGDALALALAADDYAPGKPDPACYLLAARTLGVDPGACLVFEDSAVGVAAARAAGMACVALARPDAPRQDVGAADAVLEDLGSFNPKSWT
jgi:beta-phosphoglucomutase-like phosphatase (HAD superfamily)